MKKILGLTAVGVAVGAVCVAAWAADISNLSGQSCGEQTGTWHFVNNQTGGTTYVGTLTATWTSGNTCTVSARTPINNKTQHFYCEASGTLSGASTNLPGKLVLSDFSCGTKVCDPTKEKCEPDPK